MATFKPVAAVNVEIWGQRVGAVALDPATNFYAFEYEPKFVRTDIELAPLQMPLAEASEPFIFTQLRPQTYQRLPAMLADALPDRFGNSLINAWMADRGMTAESVTAMDRLAYMGQRSMGALVFKPSRGPASAKSTALEMSHLVKQARSVIQGDFQQSDNAGEVLRQIIQVGTSAGGARAKATVAWNSTSGEVQTGQFDIPQGFDAWLLKFDGIGADEQLGVGMHYGRIEYAYSLMAKAAGITMSDCHLLQEGDRAHFMTKRFDRSGNTRHHMQTLCGMAHVDFNLVETNSYHQLFQTTLALGLGRAALEELLRRMIFNVLAANNDDHAKNFSYLLKQGGAWELAPAYDVMYAYNPDNPWIRQHLMSVNGKFSGIQKPDIAAVADRYELFGVYRVIIEQVEAAVARWPEFAAITGLPAAQTAAIQRTLQAMRF